VIHGPEPAAAEQVRELVGVGLVGLVARRGGATPVTNEDAIDRGGEEVMPPLGLRAFLEGDVDRPPQPADVLEQRGGLGRDNAACKHAATVSRTEITVVAWWT
jgi:hypothetical protein